MLPFCMCSRKKFEENLAETWWSDNRDKVYERYNVPGSDKSVGGHTARTLEEAFSLS